MPNTVFRSTSFTLRHLVDNIARGDVALPELQRPFVWCTSKVRDLFDSMYQGFPVGLCRHIFGQRSMDAIREQYRSPNVEAIPPPAMSDPLYPSEG